MGKKKRRDGAKESERPSGVREAPATADAQAQVIALSPAAARQEDDSREVEVGAREPTPSEALPAASVADPQEALERPESARILEASAGDLLPLDPFADSLLVRPKSHSTTVAFAVFGVVILAAAGLYSSRLLGRQSAPPRRPRIERPSEPERSGSLVAAPRSHEARASQDAGEAIARAGQPPRAEQAHSPAIEAATQGLGAAATPDSGEYGKLLSRGHDRWHRSRICQSQADYERAIAANPSGDAAMSALSLCYLNMGRLDEAVSMATRATDVNPTNAEGWLVRGYVLGLRHEREQARAAYQRCIDANSQLSPECVRALRQLH